MPFNIGKTLKATLETFFVWFRPMPFNIGKTLESVRLQLYWRFRPMPFNIGKTPLYFNPILMT